MCWQLTLCKKWILLKVKDGLWGDFKLESQSSGSEEKLWGLRHLNSNSGYTTSLLCDLGQVIFPLWSLVFLPIKRGNNIYFKGLLESFNEQI